MKVYICMFIFLLAFPAILLGENKSNKEYLTVKVNNNVLSINASNVSVSKILNELSRKTGVSIETYNGVYDKEVTININNLPVIRLQDVFKQIGYSNTAIIYDSNGKSLKAYILPQGKDVFSMISNGDRVGLPITQASFQSKFNDLAAADSLFFKGKSVSSFKKRGVAEYFVDNEIVLKKSPKASGKDIRDVLSKYSLKQVNSPLLEKVGYIKAILPQGSSVKDIRKKLYKELVFVHAEPNYLLGSMSATVTDPLYPYQSYIQETHFDTAWESMKKQQHVKVAVIDTGVNGAHPDLAGKVLEGRDFFNETESFEDIKIGSGANSDDNGHGTFVAGIIAAQANDIGIRGLHSQAEVIPVKVVGADGIGSYEDTALGIIWAADAGAKVINLSLGGYSFSYMLQDAVDYALAKGAALVAAGGNEGVSAKIYPAAYPNVIGVSALGADGNIWSSSNHGSYIDICAPGEAVLSTGVNGGYVFASGTSASAAIVSSSISELIGERNDLSVSYLSQTLFKTAGDLGDKGRDDIYGAGVVNANSMLRKDISEFHDICVYSVGIENKVLHEEGIAQVNVGLGNYGSYPSEKAEIELWLLRKGDKKLLGTKEIFVSNFDSVSFDLPSEDVADGFLLEAVSKLEHDDYAENNVRRSGTFQVSKENGLVYIKHKSEAWMQPHQYFAGEAARLWPGGNEHSLNVTVKINSIKIGKDGDYGVDTGDIFFKVYINDTYALLNNEGKLYSLNDGDTAQVNKKEQETNVSIGSEDTLSLVIIGVDDDGAGPDCQDAYDCITDSEVIGRITNEIDLKHPKDINWTGCNPEDKDFCITADVEISYNGNYSTSTVAQKEIWSHIGTKLFYHTFSVTDPDDEKDYYHDLFPVTTYTGNKPISYKPGYKGKFPVPYYGTVPFSSLEIENYGIVDITIPKAKYIDNDTAGSLNIPGNSIIEGAMEEDLFNVDALDEYPFQSFSDYFYNGTTPGALCMGKDEDCIGAYIFKNHFWKRGSHENEDNEGMEEEYQSAYAKAQYYWNKYVIPDYMKGSDATDLSYYFLGRVVHLLADMTVPAHVLSDSHMFGDNYEEYVGEHYYNFSVEGNGIYNNNPNERLDYYTIGDLQYTSKDFAAKDIKQTSGDREGKVWLGKEKEAWENKERLFQLFWVTAELTDDYDSDDEEGEVFDVRNAALEEGVDEKELPKMAKKLVPLALKSTAELYHLFWGSTHFPTEMVNNEFSSFIEDTNSDLADAMRSAYIKELGSPSLDCLVKKYGDAYYYRIYTGGKIFCDDSGDSPVCIATQDGDELLEKWLSLDDQNMTSLGNFVYVTPALQEADKEDGTVTFGLKNIGINDAEWTVSENSDWLSVSPSTGMNDGTVTVNYDANSGDARTGTITFSVNGTSSSKTVEVRQAGKTVSSVCSNIGVAEATSGFTWPLPYNFSNNGGYTFKELDNYISGKPVYHPGEDWNVPGPPGGAGDGDLGLTVVAVADGKVVYANPNSWGGVVILHNYQNDIWYSQYGHVQNIKVEAGDFVKKGKKIAEIGKVGLGSAAHLHFEIRTSDHPNPCYGAYWTYGTDGLYNLNNIDKWYESPTAFITANQYQAISIETLGERQDGNLKIVSVQSDGSTAGLGNSGRVLINGTSVASDWTKDGVKLNSIYSAIGLRWDNFVAPLHIEIFDKKDKKIADTYYPFNDIGHEEDACSEYWYRRPVIQLWKEGIVNGYSDGNRGRFGAGNSASRAELVKMMVGIVESGNPPKDVTVAPFADVPADKWYAKYIAYAKAKGWVQGCDTDNNLFCPNDSINRAEAAKIISKALEPDLLEEIINGRQPEWIFPDVQDQGKWYYPYIYTLQAAHAVHGFSDDGTFRPETTISRAELAKIICITGFSETECNCIDVQ